MISMTDLKSIISSVKVSSVLNRDVKQYGKKHLMDGDDDTCWNSDQGQPQWIQMNFESPQSAENLNILIQFQGGFCGKDCLVELSLNGNKVDEMPFYPDDTNSSQNFAFKLSTVKIFDGMKFLFQKSTDFFGRIIVYNLDLKLN